MKEEIKKLIVDATGVSADKFSVEIPAEKNHGDYSTNVALVLAKKIGKSPAEVASLIHANKKIQGSGLFEKVEVAGPGFINFFVSDKIFLDNLKTINKDYGKNGELKNKKVILDYTDPNPFKEFHIGHLMSNAIGESLSRIFEFEGAKVKRVCYQGDVGIHVAKAIWGMQTLQNDPDLELHNSVKDKVQRWGVAYKMGAAAYGVDENTRKDIVELNKKIYERSDKEINKLYDEGKKLSLEHFDKIYKKLGTKFDWLIFESETGPAGKKIVAKWLEKGMFEKGEKGAIIFKGEKCGLHTRVFINSVGLPTYEAKDLGLAEIKYKKYKYDKSVVVTGNEVNEYFKVMLCAMKEVLPDLASKTKHIGHGMLRLPEGKMSSRTGKVITGESLLEKLEEMVRVKIAARNFSSKEEKTVAEKVAVGAIRYSILKQSIGSDIIYDFDKSISFEGDSGPYLQYSYTRAVSVLRKAKEQGVKPSLKNFPAQVADLEKSIYHFPEAVLQAGKSLEPHYILLYLTELAATFNAYYAKNKIVDRTDKLSSYKVALAQAFSVVMKNGMWLLGIETLDRM